MNSVLKYVASGSKGTINSLSSELYSITGCYPKPIPSLDALEFSANQKQLMDVCFKSHLIENLKVQIGRKFPCNNESQLKTALKKLPLHAFVKPTDSPLHYSLVCKDSNLKAKQAEKVFEAYMRQKFPHVGKVLENNDQNYQNKSFIQAIGPKLELTLNEGSGRLYTVVNTAQMYKHGWKERVNYAPLRESIAAAVLFDSGIIQEAKKQKSLKLWDPFCGSGTLVLEALALYADLPIRTHGDWLASTDWPCFDLKLFERYKQTMEESSKVLGDISILASDIDLETVNDALQNFRHMNLNVVDHPDKAPFIRRKPQDRVFSVSQNQVCFAAEDFQKVGRQILVGNQMTMVANLPYGHRSRQKTPISQLLSTYKRFDTFLKEERGRFKGAFILLPSASSFNPNHFISVSSLNWSLKNVYNSGGKQVGMYQLQANTSVQLSLGSMQSTHLAKSLPQDQTSLDIIEKANKTMKVNTRLPQYVIANEKKGLGRVQARRKIHQMKQDYKEHALVRAQQTSLKRFQSQRRKEKLVQRGEAWKQENLRILGDRIDSPKYSSKISASFQKKIESAIQAKDKDKEYKEKKKAVNKGREVPVRKW